MSKIVKKVGKGISKVWKKVWKPVKKFLGSNFGQILMIAVAIFTAGVGLGFWAGPAWMGGAGGTAASIEANAAGSAVAQSAAAGASDLAALTSASEVLGTGVAAGGAELSILGGAEAAAQGAIAAGSQGVAQGAALQATRAGGSAVASNAAKTVGGAVTDQQALAAGSNILSAPGVAAPEIAANSATGIIGRIKDLAGGAAKFSRENQLVTAMGIQAAASALTPSADELAQEQEKRDEKRIARNLSVGDLQVSRGNNAGQPLRRPGGEEVYDENGTIKRRGLVNRRLPGAV